ncbi:MAG: HAMP domain-containing histidine kinase [Elusimicrobia bacterium]|nr:HAMP domain-containing histidine kinase [Elusimicrobiota bacterium]
MRFHSRVRFLIVSEEAALDLALRREFSPCSAARTCELRTLDLARARAGGLPPGSWDVILLAAGERATPADAQRLLALAPGARLVVFHEGALDEERRQAFLAAGASAVMRGAAALRCAFHGMRPCTVWRGRQVESLLFLRSRISELRGLEARRSEFLEDLFHELRSPLTVVNASIRLLVEDAEEQKDPKRLEVARMAARNCEHLLRRVLNLLERSKLEAAPRPPERSAFDLEALARETAETCRAAANRPLRVSVRAHRPLPPAYADREMAEQVLENLLDNAARFARSRVLVALRARSDAGEVEAMVLDDGPGLDSTKAVHLFERFQQGARAPGTGYKGTGLGLPICRDLVALNGGRIWAEPRRHPGARIHFTLPAAVPAAKESGRGSPPLVR